MTELAIIVFSVLSILATLAVIGCAKSASRADRMHEKFMNDFRATHKGNL